MLVFALHISEHRSQAQTVLTTAVLVLLAVDKRHGVRVGRQGDSVLSLRMTPAWIFISVNAFDCHLLVGEMDSP